MADTRCKGCTGKIDTQEHCLNVCQANMPAIRACHDRVMERLVGAIPDSLGTNFLDQTVPGCPGLLRPDVVILHEEQKKTFLIDVACSCDHPQNMTAARGRKREKYAAIKEQLEGKGFQVCYDGFIVGSLGTWDPENDHLLRGIGVRDTVQKALLPPLLVVTECGLPDPVCMLVGLPSLNQSIS